MMSAREPVSCEVIPRDFTEGAWDAGAGPTSKEILENRCLSVGFRCSNIGISWINRNVNVEKSSARVLDAETTRMFLEGSRSNWWTT
jgi:hypothetical protein